MRLLHVGTGRLGLPRPPPPTPAHSLDPHISIPSDSASVRTIAWAEEHRLRGTPAFRVSPGAAHLQAFSKSAKASYRTTGGSGCVVLSTATPGYTRYVHVYFLARSGDLPVWPQTGRAVSTRGCPQMAAHIHVRACSRIALGLPPFLCCVLPTRLGEFEACATVSLAKRDHAVMANRPRARF